MQIKVSEILNDLTNGLTRADIKAKYNLSTAQMKSIFSHPKLKGRKTKQVTQPIELVDDMEVSPAPVPVRIQAELPFVDRAILDAEEVEETVRPDVQEETEEDIFS